MIELFINGRGFFVKEGTTAAAAVLTCGTAQFRSSVTGEPRAPLCGMGICYECRLTIDGVQHARSCRIMATEGMRIETT